MLKLIYILFIGGIEMQIGFFDSGIGGITVLHDAVKMLPNEGCGNIAFYNSGIKVEDKAELDKYNKLFQRLDTINE